MAEHGEWNQKRAALSDVTAKSEYGVSRDFIIDGIEAGRLEYRDGATWGNPYIRLLRSQLEKYITEKLGEGYLVRVKGQAELRMIKKEISDLRKKLSALQDRKAILEQMLETQKAQ
jgi:flagellar capping protein FliD